MSSRRAVGVLADALARIGFAPRHEGVWRHGDWTARASDGWLELRTRPSMGEHAGRAFRWTKPFTDPLFGARVAGRTHAGVRLVELPPPLLEPSSEPDELAELLAWVIGTSASGEPPAAIAPGALLSAGTLAFQRGSIVRQGRLTIEADVARIGFPLLQTPVQEVAQARRLVLAELLADAARNWRWLRMGLDAASCPSVEIAVPATAVGAVSGLAPMARDALGAFLVWAVPAVEFVAAGDAACLDGRLTWANGANEANDTNDTNDTDDAGARRAARA